MTKPEFQTGAVRTKAGQRVPPASTNAPDFKTSFTLLGSNRSGRRRLQAGRLFPYFGIGHSSFRGATASVMLRGLIL